MLEFEEHGTGRGKELGQEVHESLASEGACFSPCTKLCVFFYFKNTSIHRVLPNSILINCIRLHSMGVPTFIPLYQTVYI